MVGWRHRAAFLLVCALLQALWSCRSAPCGGDSCAQDGEVEEGPGVEAEIDPDAREAYDLEVDGDPSEAEDVAVEDAEADQAPEGCSLPVIDCGPGCRQVTCMAPITSSWGWDVYGSSVAYYSEMEPLNGLYMKDLESGEEVLLYRYPYFFHTYFLCMYGERIVFERLLMTETPEQSLIAYRIDSSSIEEIFRTPEGGYYFIDLDFHGSRVVTSGALPGYGEGHWDILMYDFSLGEMRALTSYGYGVMEPKIWGDTVVYTFMGNPFRIRMVDLATGEDRPITDAPADQWNADLWGKRVAWMDHRNAPGGYYGTTNTDIYWCDLPDCEARPATTNFATQENPAVDGDWIVWLDFRNDVYPVSPEYPHHENLEIWGYNVVTDLEYQIASFNETLWDLRIQNGKVYFTRILPGYTIEQAVFEIELPEP